MHDATDCTTNIEKLIRSATVKTYNDLVKPGKEFKPISQRRLNHFIKYRGKLREVCIEEIMNVSNLNREKAIDVMILGLDQGVFSVVMEDL